MTAHGTVQVSPAARYAVQAVRQPYTLAHLDHVEVFLLDVTDQGDYGSDLSQPGEQDLGPLFPTGADDVTPMQVRLANLKAAKQYKVRLEAYQVDPANGTTSTPIRVDDRTAANISSFSTGGDGGANDDVGDLTFTLRLADQPFSGQAGGSVSVTDGTLVPGTKPLAIVLPVQQ
ncbi:MAG: hypothetical protein JWM80_4547 [Cyanobacteria bacterium RYN_339]|nr:hypothetical protein [Cyanobacteria bacterium RYN_339]